MHFDALMDAKPYEFKNKSGRILMLFTEICWPVQEAEEFYFCFVFEDVSNRSSGNSVRKLNPIENFMHSGPFLYTQGHI